MTARFSFYATVGHPTLHYQDDATGLSLQVTPPCDVMFDIVRQSALWVLHNGTDKDRDHLRELTKELHVVFGATDD